MNYFIKLQKWANQFSEVNAMPATEIYVILYMLSLFKIIKHIQLSECHIMQLNILMNFFQETENQDVISLLGCYFITKVLEGIKQLSRETESPKSLLSSSDLKRAFQYLEGVEMNLTNLRLMIILVLSFVGFLKFSKLLN